MNRSHLCRRTFHIAVLLGRDEIINFKPGKILLNALYTNGKMHLKQWIKGQTLRQCSVHTPTMRLRGSFIYPITCSVQSAILGKEMSDNSNTSISMYHRCKGGINILTRSSQLNKIVIICIHKMHIYSTIKII